MAFVNRKIEEHELIEFFGVLPEVDEEDYCESYRVVQENLVLETTFFYPEGIYISLNDEEANVGRFKAEFEGEYRIRRKTGKVDYDCLEIEIPHLERYGEPNWQATFELRLFVNPSIKIEMVR